MARAVLALLTAATLFCPTVRADEPKVAPKSDAFLEVEVRKDLAYREGKDADPIKHKLDLYLPKGVKNFPVMMYVHGGSWKSGRKELYGALGALFARNGIGTAVINYRLSTGEKPAKHPDHVTDVARAFAWLHQNIAKDGGRTDRMFVSGHSAGAHLVSLLATDERYLKSEKLTAGDIRGVLALSGVYSIAPIIPVFHLPFGKDEEVCKQASPLTHVKGKHPPFLICYADKDLPTIDKMSAEFCEKLKDCKCEAAAVKVRDRNHFTIIISLCTGESDPCTRSMFEFIGKHSEWKAPVKK
jgi:hypothetical protein